MSVTSTFLAWLLTCVCSTAALCAVVVVCWVLDGHCSNDGGAPERWPRFWWALAVLCVSVACVGTLAEHWGGW